MEIVFTEEDILEFRNELERCKQRLQELQQETQVVTTRGVELQGILKAVEAKKEQETTA